MIIQPGSRISEIWAGQGLTKAGRKRREGERDEGCTPIPPTRRPNSQKIILFHSEMSDSQNCRGQRQEMGVKVTTQTITQCLEAELVVRVWRPHYSVSCPDFSVGSTVHSYLWNDTHLWPTNITKTSYKHLKNKEREAGKTVEGKHNESQGGEVTGTLCGEEK
jgi:hypothetical protein